MRAASRRRLAFGAARAPPRPPPRPPRLREGGRVQLVRGRDEACPVSTGEGRGLSSKYEGRDEACPVSTGGKGGGRLMATGPSQVTASDDREVKTWEVRAPAPAPLAARGPAETPPAASPGEPPAVPHHAHDLSSA